MPGSNISITYLSDVSAVAAEGALPSVCSQAALRATLGPAHVGPGEMVALQLWQANLDELIFVVSQRQFVLALPQELLSARSPLVPV